VKKRPEKKSSLVPGMFQPVDSLNPRLAQREDQADKSDLTGGNGDGDGMA